MAYSDWSFSLPSHDTKTLGRLGTIEAAAGQKVLYTLEQLPAPAWASLRKQFCSIKPYLYSICYNKIAIVVNKQPYRNPEPDPQAIVARKTPLIVGRILEQGPVLLMAGWVNEARCTWWEGQKEEEEQ